MTDISKLRMYSIGIVVKDKIQGDNKILVTPIETLNQQEKGKLESTGRKFEGVVKNPDSKEFTSSNFSANYFVAKWISLATSNRVTAPDVRAGESVLLYKFADIEEFFWEDMKLEDDLRRLEDVTYRFGGIDKGNKGNLDKDNSYWIRVNTYDKYIKLHTSMSNGEPFGYDIEINTGSGFIKITDNSGNDITLDSPTDTITVNSDKDVNINTKNAVNVVTTSLVSVKTTDVTLEASGNIIMKAGGSISMESPTIEVSGVDISVNGPVQATGPINVISDVIAGGKSLITHMHTTTIPGTPTSTPI